MTTLFRNNLSLRIVSHINKCPVFWIRVSAYGKQARP
jgi:hypothetical protein